jgi:hypothetical protein
VQLPLERAGNNCPPSPCPFHEPAVGSDIALRCPAAPPFQRADCQCGVAPSCRKIKHPWTAQRAVRIRFRGPMREPCLGEFSPPWRGFHYIPVLNSCAPIDHSRWYTSRRQERFSFS